MILPAEPAAPNYRNLSSKRKGYDAALRSRPLEAAPLRCEHGRIPTACPHCGTMPSGPVEGETPETDAMQYDIDNPPKSWQKLYEHACRLERRLRAPRQDPRRRCLDGHLVEDDGTCETCKVEAELVNLRSRPADGEVAEALKAADGKSHLDDWYGCYLHAKHARTLAAAYRSKAEECERVRGALDDLLRVSHDSSETSYCGEDPSPWFAARALLAPDGNKGGEG